MAITFEDRKDFVDQVARLSLWLARHYQKKGFTFFGAALTSQTPLYRLTSWWDGVHHPADSESEFTHEAWDNLVTELLALADQNPSDIYEAKGFSLFQPHLDSRIQLDLEAWPYLPSGIGAAPYETGLFGFWLYEFIEEAKKPMEISLHMGNSFAPESPFKDNRARTGELLRLLEDARERKPGVVWISSESWLNSFEPFQYFFPFQWTNSTRPTTLGYCYNWWGQFMTRRGSYHRRNGEVLRQTGIFPYQSVICRCEVDELMAHLRRL